MKKLYTFALATFLAFTSASCGPKLPVRTGEDLWGNPSDLPEQKRPDVISLMTDFKDFVTGVTASDSVTLSAGVKEYYMEITTTHTNPLKFCVFEVDLTEPSITFEVTYPTSVSTDWPVSNMVNQAKAIDKAGHRVIGAVNSDFFDMGGSGYPLGTVWSKGKEIKSTYTSGGDGVFFCLTKSGRPVFGWGQDEYNNLNKADIQELVCGMYNLVRSGNSVAPQDGVKAPRTCIGATSDCRTVYIVVADELEPASPRDGISLADLALCMIQIGCCDAINFDGGGSSTFVVRQSDGSFATPNKQPGAYLRPVANGLAIISSAK